MVEVGGSITDLYISLTSTVFSIVKTMVQLCIESKGYHEHPCEYIMLSMKAKQDWIPFGNQIKANSIKFDINYSLIELRLPFITNILGLYQEHLYQFSDDNLKKLFSILDEKLTNQVEYDIKLKTVNENCTNNVIKANVNCTCN